MWPMANEVFESLSGIVDYVTYVVLTWEAHDGSEEENSAAASWVSIMTSISGVGDGTLGTPLDVSG